MISPKKLIKMARKWQKMAAIRRKRITLPTFVGNGTDRCSKSSMPEKGHFVVYTADRRRLVLPLVFLNNKIVRELFNLAEEEFGLPTNGPLTLPCDAAFMEYITTLIQQYVAEDLEKALLMSIASGHCLSSSYLQQEQTNQQLLICGF